LSEVEDQVYVILFKEFGGDNEVDLKVNFVKIYERFDQCD